MRKFLSFLPFLLVTAWLTVRAENNLQLRHINTKGYVINSMCRDADGVLWLATQSGLVSLPQLESRSPQYYLRGKDSLYACIDHIFADSEGRLWMKTLNRDVLCYQPRTDTFYADAATLLAQQGIQLVKEFSVGIDESGSIWAWRNNHLYNVTLGTPIGSKVIRGNIHGFISDDSQLILLTEKTLCFLSQSKRLLIDSVVLPLELQGAYYILSDNNGSVWVWNHQLLYRYNRKAKTWDVTVQMPSNINACIRKNDGSLWIGTKNDGIFVCDATGHITRQICHDPWDKSSLQNNHINLLFYESDRDVVWISYAKGGLSAYNLQQNGYQPRCITSLTAEQSRCDFLSFTESADGSRLLAGLEEGGIFEYDKKTDEWTNISRDNPAMSMYTDRRGNLWVGYFAKGLQANCQKERFYFPNSSPQAIADDSQGQLYVALLGEGVWLLDPVTGKTTDTHIGVNYPLDLKFYGQQLHAATSEGFFIKDGTHSWQKVLDGQYRSLVVDNSGTVWLLGNDGNEGLTIVGANGQTLPVPEELSRAPLRSIAIDTDNRIWIAATTELIMLERKKGKLQQYNFNLNPESSPLYYNTRAIFIDHAGYLWLGTTCGYQCLNLQQMVSKMQQPRQQHPMQLCAISLNDRVLSAEQLGADVIFTQHLDLSANENNLVVECIPAYDEGQTIDTYYYKLEGLAATWHPIKDRTIVLSNLPPGHYNLFTRTQNSLPSQLLEINIAPPFWRTWWACLIYLLLAALVIWAAWRYAISRRHYQLQLRELQLQQEQQTQVNEIKLRFFTNISHDLRTPLSLIIGPIEELLKSEESTTKQSSLQIIERNARHLLQLVNQILDFRRLELDRERLVLNYGDIVSHLTDVCSSFRLKANKEGIHFSFQSTVERVETHFDRDKLTKIMMNLLSNAFKFTPEGGTVTVGLDISDGQVIVSVTDSGTGIPDTDKPHIFDRFYQSTATGDGTLSMGSGIGLHIVREYVRLHGGNISVSDNTPSQGTVFKFNIPLRKQNATLTETKTDAADHHINSKLQETSTEAEVNTPILLVDDNTDLLTYMSQCLCAEYHILTATNGEEAIQRLKKSDVDIVISDVMMPVMDGLELCRRVKTNIETSHIPVVLLTAKAMNNDELRGLEAGADDYITKPFSMDILRQRIHNIMERSHYRHQRFKIEVDISPSEITVTSLDEDFIRNAISTVEKHIGDDSFGVEQLAKEMGMHRAQLYKKLVHLTGKSPVLFIRLLRLKRGRQLLEQSGMYVSEVAYRVGFCSPRLFSKYFKEEFGVSPKEYGK